MNLRSHLGLDRPRAKWALVLVAVLGVAVLSLGRASPPAGAALSDYSPLYLSGATSTISGLSASRTLVTSAGPGAPSTAPAVTLDPAAGILATGAYSYEYTRVDSTNGETAPSPAASVAVVNTQVDVSGLPVGVRVRLYRTCPACAQLYYRVDDFTPGAASPQFVDNLSSSVGTSPNVTANLLPQAQTKAPVQTGYYEFAPGVPLGPGVNSTRFATPAFSRKGWVVDASGRVSFPSGTWTFAVNLCGPGGAGTARLDIGLYKVDDTGAAVGSAIIDPATTGENASANIVASCTPIPPPTVTTTILNVPAISLAANEHLYVQFWRDQKTTTSAGTITMFAFDGVAQITHPTGNAFPNTPGLAAPANAARVNATPQLSATFSDSDVGDTGTLNFQLCAGSDPTCISPIDSGSSAPGIVNGGTGTWTAPSINLGDGAHDGTYYWRVQAKDSFAATNLSDWSSTRSFVVDTVKPTVSSVTASDPNGPYDAGKTIHIQVGFSEPVNVMGSPKLALNTSPAESATYASGTGTSTLTFTYTVQPGDNVAALDFSGIGALTLNSGTIADAATNAATLTLPSPGAAGSLAANKSLDIDTTPPTVSGVTASNANGAYTAGQTISVEITFGEPVTVTGSPHLALNTTPAESAVYASGSGTATLAFTYVVQAGDNVATLGYTGAGALSLNGGAIADAAGNGATLTLASPGAAGSLSASRSLRIDTNPPGTSGVDGPANAADLDAAPTLTATFTNSDAGDTGNLDFQVCRNAACTDVAQSSSPGPLSNGASRSWTPSGLLDGVYYWRIGAHDAVGNQYWPATTQSVTLDTTPPSGPTSGGAVAGALVTAAPTLAATYTDATSGGVTGLLVFEVCTTNTCTTVVEATTVASLHQNDAASWVPPGLGDGTYYWHVRAEDSAGNLSPWSDVRSFSIDGTPPPAPVVSSTPGEHVHAAPQLGATVIEPGNPGDSSRLLIELCADSACTSIVATGYSGVVSVDTAAGWQAPQLADGVYYWRARAEDAAGNQSPWSAVASFVVDTVPPAVPVQGAPADGAIVNTPHVSGVPGTPAAGVAFQVCADAACVTVLAGGYAETPASGAAPSWAATGLSDGTYYWRIAAHDEAGNASAWSETKSFVLDQTPPGTPRGLEAKVKGTTLTLHWLAPAVVHHLVGYAVFANGKRIRTVTLKTHTVRIQLRKSEKRVFTVVSFDAAGNVSRPTRQIAAVSLPLANRTARVAATPVAHRR